MTTKEFNGLLRMAVEKYGLDPAKTYVESTWGTSEFRPLIAVDCDRDENMFTMVFGKTLCNIWGAKFMADVIPCGFYVEADQPWPDMVVHRSATMSALLDNELMLGFNNVKFLFEASPGNYRVHINPFKTRIYRNWANEVIFCLYVVMLPTDRPILQMSEDDLVMIDKSPFSAAPNPDLSNV